MMNVMKYGLTVILAALMWNKTILAQFPFSMHSSASQQMIEKSCGGGLVLVSGEYQVADSTGQRFTFDGQSYVGRKVSFGVLAGGGIIAGREVLRPWDGDKADYDTAAYKPVISKVQALHLASSEWTDLPCPEADLCLSFLPDSNWCYSAGFMDGAEGFALDTTAAGNVDGWIVLLTGTEKKDSLDMVSYRHSVEFKKNMNIYELPDNSMTAKIYGGVYLCPVYDGIGRITFVLSGIILTEDSGWKLLKIDPALGIREEASSGKKGNSGQLVPVGGGKPSSGGDEVAGTGKRKRKSNR